MFVKHWAFDSVRPVGRLYVTDTPPGESDGGGQPPAPTADSDAGEPTEEIRDPAKALAAARAARAEADELKRRLAALESKADPRQVEEARREAEEARRRLEERERVAEAERQRLELKSNEAIQAAKREAETERQRRIDLQIRTNARSSFEAAKGRRGADEEGRTFFDAFMATIGSKHLRYDESSDRVYVVDAQGDPVPDPDGNGRIDVVKWMNQLADKSDVIGSLFEPAMGEGSGMGTSRGPRTSRGQNLDSIRHNKKALFAAKWGD